MLREKYRKKPEKIKLSILWASKWELYEQNKKLFCWKHKSVYIRLLRLCTKKNFRQIFIEQILKGWVSFLFWVVSGINLKKKRNFIQFSNELTTGISYWRKLFTSCQSFLLSCWMSWYWYCRSLFLNTTRSFLIFGSFMFLWEFFVLN